MKKVLHIVLASVFLLTNSVTICAQEAKKQEEALISLDFKGMNIVDVLKLLAQRGNINIAISKNVRGKVTMFLKDVSVFDAFEIILASNQLAFEEKNNILNVMTERDYE